MLICYSSNKNQYKGISKKGYDSGRRPLFNKYSFPQRYEGLQAWNGNRILFLSKATFWEQEGSALKVKNKIGEIFFFKISSRVGRYRWGNLPENGPKRQRYRKLARKVQIRGVPEEHRRIHKWVLVAISMWEKVPTPKSNSQTPAGSPTIQLDSDTIYLDEASDSTGKQFNPMWLPHPGQSQVQFVTCASDSTG